MAYLENDFISPIIYTWLRKWTYLENDFRQIGFISPIIYTWPLLTKKTTSLAQLFIHDHEAYLENDFITWPWIIKKTTSLAQLFIHDHGLLRKRLH